MAAVLELKHITKKYPGVVALDDVSLSFQAGEVHAIVGENGAGKSTFIKVITGAIQPTSGEIYFEGEKIEHNSPQYALSVGITAIYQEMDLLPYLSVAENIFYNRYITRHGMIDFSATEKKAGEILKKLGVHINPKMLVKNLSAGYQQLVEIAKSLSRTVKVMIMDEPSAPLTNNELKYLFDIVKVLKKEGIAIIYISHRMEEIFEICDKVSVFRDGHYIMTTDVANTNQNELIHEMVNRDLGDAYPAIQLTRGEKVLEVKNLCNSLLKNVSFDAYRGERLGLAGLVGAGRSETAMAIYGADKITEGEIWLNGQKLQIKSPADAVKNGIVLIPEERKQQGTFLHMSIEDNMLFAYLPQLTNFMKLVDVKKADELCEKQIRAFSIKTPSKDQMISNLSGGNQQKVILAKWMLMNSDVIILDEPTRGIDVGAKQEIYELINQLAAADKVIIVITSELPELLGMTDRILVMAEGKISGEIYTKNATQEKILEMASVS